MARAIVKTIGIITGPVVAAISALNIDMSSADKFYKTISATSTFTISNPVEGKDIAVVIRNTSGATVTANFPVVWRVSTYDLLVEAGKTNLYSFAYINGTYYGSYISKMVNA